MEVLPVRNPIDVILAALGPLDGARILELGCGHGALAKALALAGAKVVGVDPEPAALKAARRAVPAALFVQAGAEALPVRDAAFEGAVFQNALHHIPAP